MATLLLIGYFAGVIAGVSPCILPILPIVFVAWTSPLPESIDNRRQRQRRALSVVAGLVLSFGIITATGTALISSLGLPQNFLHDAGIALLVIFGVGLVVPAIGHVLERPFARLTRNSATGSGSGFVLGLSLGLVFVPCAGPVLAAISVLGARHQFTIYSLLLSLLFAAGAATPLLTIALAGDRLIERNRRLAARARRWRPVGGVLLVAIGLSLAFNLAAPLQRALPSYTQSLQNWLEGNAQTSAALRQLQNQSTTGSLVTCENLAAAGRNFSTLNCGQAPEFRGITAWLNTPGEKPLTMGSLRGHVVLIDFWTYSCINCQRSLPHVEAWYQRYHQAGLEVIGIEAPEFAFEHQVANIAAAAKTLGVTYPVAVDDNLATWNAYENQYWPAEYLIDASGAVRHVDYGEGHYSDTEKVLRSLLAAHAHSPLPAPTSVPNLTPLGSLSPETYLGTDRSQYLNNGAMTTGASATYRGGYPPLGSYDLGGTWRTEPEYIEAGHQASLTLNFQAAHVYLVLGGTGTVTVSLDGRTARTLHVSGYPTLYTLASLPRNGEGLLTLGVSPGVRAYDFTFG